MGILTKGCDIILQETVDRIRLEGDGITSLTWWNIILHAVDTLTLGQYSVLMATPLEEIFQHVSPQ